MAAGAQRRAARELGRHAQWKRTEADPALGMKADVKALPRVVFVRACGATSLQIAFSDGTSKRVNVARFLSGPIFEPLHDPKYFRRAGLDPIGGTVVWPNGADIAPETLYVMEPESGRTRSRREHSARGAARKNGASSTKRRPRRSGHSSTSRRR